jgi:hypothetical protein
MYFAERLKGGGGMVWKNSGERAGAGGTKSKKRWSGMQDVIVLAAALIFILAACTTAKTGDKNAEDTSPGVSVSPSVAADTSAGATPSAEPTPADPTADIPYPEYALNSKLYPGIQSGVYPWGYDFSAAYVTSSPSGDMPGTVFYKVMGDQYRLFFHHIEETGKDVVSAFMSTANTWRTARGIKRGDSVEELLEAYGDCLLYVPEPFPISRDLGGDFFVYDELFVYTRPEDDNCCLVFYVATNIDSKMITGIQISLGRDGGPAYAADDVTTFAVDDADPDKYIKTDTTDEEYFCKQFLAQGTDGIFKALAQINWRILYRLYPEVSVDAINWLYKQKITDENDILCILKATKGLDGGLSEGYSGILGNIYREDSRRFIRLSSLLDTAQIDAVAQLLCYDLCPDKADIIAELKDFQKNDRLTDQEQLVVGDILYALSCSSY